MDEIEGVDARPCPSSCLPSQALPLPPNAVLSHLISIKPGSAKWSPYFQIHFISPATYLVLSDTSKSGRLLSTPLRSAQYLTYTASLRSSSSLGSGLRLLSHSGTSPVISHRTLFHYFGMAYPGIPLLDPSRRSSSTPVFHPAPRTTTHDPVGD
jgi:hypothetical protein